MNSDVRLISGAPDATRRLDRAERWLAAFEARFSRFRALSELSRLNAAAGRTFQASPRLFELVALALALARRSEGVYDPTILPALLAAGYDRSFELGRSRPELTETRRLRTTWRDVRLDAALRTVTFPKGGALDLGGIGKGWAVDRLAGMLGRPALVNGGGDVFAAGRPPDDSAWRVGVADPFRPESDLYVLRLVDRGVATSSSLRRRWRSGDRYLHHLIDPHTGRPSESDAVQVSAIASSALMADHHAKVALLLGGDRGLAYLQREREVEGVVVRWDGSIGVTRHLGDYL
jgi:thiamine biosynthesis lipoprotein